MSTVERAAWLGSLKEGEEPRPFPHAAAAAVARRLWCCATAGLLAQHGRWHAQWLATCAAGAFRYRKCQQAFVAHPFLQGLSLPSLLCALQQCLAGGLEGLRTLAVGPCRDGMPVPTSLQLSSPALCFPPPFFLRTGRECPHDLLPWSHCHCRPGEDHSGPQGHGQDSAVCG